MGSAVLTHSADSLPSAICASTAVQYKHGRIPGIPEVHALPRSAASSATLFYFGQTPFRTLHPKTALISVGGRTSTGSTKILWWLPGGNRTLTIAGSRVGEEGTFKQTAHRSLGGAPSYPSIVNIPTAGCWRLTITSGRVAARVVFRAIELPH
jgi:hypothetical protein